VVSTDVGDVRKIMRGFGIIVPPRNPEALAEAVVKLLKDDELRLHLGRKARQEILTKYCDSMMVDTYLKLYQRLARKEENLGANFANADEGAKEIMATSLAGNTTVL
jgi:glycosyltransferase involved in cell wall biosynthesis